MRPFTLVYRLLMFGLTAGVCIGLASRFGPWAAIGIWTAGIGALCGGVGLLMKRQPMGEVTFVNRLTAVVLPWGFRIGRGKLLPIVIESWFRWVLLGIAVVVLLPYGLGAHSQQAGAYHRGLTASVLLLVSWLIDGTVVLRLITTLLMRGHANPIAPGTIVPIFVLIGMIAASAALACFAANWAMTGAAVLIAGGPIVVIGGGYGLVLAVMALSGRKARWN
jgi:hypothetical protein